MPRIPRREAHRRLSEIDKWQKLHLTDGHPMLAGCGFDTREEFEEAWKLYRDELMEEFREEHPDRMPFGWWLCDHGKERPVVNSPHGIDVDAIREANSRYHFGFLHTSISCGTREEPREWQQPERDYLIEHGIIEQWS